MGALCQVLFLADGLLSTPCRTKSIRGDSVVTVGSLPANIDASRIREVRTGRAGDV